MTQDFPLINIQSPTVQIIWRCECYKLICNRISTILVLKTKPILI